MTLVLSRFVESLTLITSVTVSAILKMVYLGSFGQYGDFLFDSTEITIWYVRTCAAGARYVCSC